MPDDATGTLLVGYDVEHSGPEPVTPPSSSKQPARMNDSGCRCRRRSSSSAGRSNAGYRRSGHKRRTRSFEPLSMDVQPYWYGALRARASVLFR